MNSGENGRDSVGSLPLSLFYGVFFLLQLDSLAFFFFNFANHDEQRNIIFFIKHQMFGANRQQFINKYLHESVAPVQYTLYASCGLKNAAENFEWKIKPTCVRAHTNECFRQKNSVLFCCRSKRNIAIFQRHNTTIALCKKNYMFSATK